MKTLLSIIFITSLSISGINAQSIVGKWKTVSMLVVQNNGTSSDVRTMQLKHWPCMAEIQTIFEADGKQYTKSEKKCGPIDYNKMPPSTWKIAGNKISITNDAMPTPLGTTSTYTVNFAGNKAILTHEYTDSEKSALHSQKVKKVILTYERI